MRFSLFHRWAGRLLGLALCTSPALVCGQSDPAVDMPSATGQTELRLRGSHRSRLEFLDNQFRPALQGSDQAYNLRTLIEASLRHRALALVLELEDARTYLTDEGSALSTIQVNVMELLQAYASLSLSSVLQTGDQWLLKAGTFTMDIGSRRFVGRNRYRNTIQNYTGVQSLWRSPGGTTVNSFWALPVLIKPVDPTLLKQNRRLSDRQDRHLQLWGLHVSQTLKARHQLEAYVLGLHERDNASNPDTANRELYTPGLRWLTSPQPGFWDLELELNTQFGRRRRSLAPEDTVALQVRAFHGHASVGYTLRHDWQPRLSLEYDVGSGDQPDDSRHYRRFDSLFGTRRFQFGPTGSYGLLSRENIHSAGLRLAWEPSARSDVFVSWRANWLASRRDIFARTGLVDRQGNSGRFAGHQLEGGLRHWFWQQRLQIDVGAALFQRGGFMRRAPNRNGEGSPLFVYGGISVYF